jgi:hypothetical protein
MAEARNAGHRSRNCFGRRQVFKVLLAGEYALEGSQESGAVGILRDVTGGAQLLGTQGGLSIGVHVQYKHAR